METPNFKTETVPPMHDDLLSGIKTKIFWLNEDERELWKHLPNVTYSSRPNLIGRYPKVRVVIPEGAKAYSHGRVVVDNKIVFTYYA